MQFAPATTLPPPTSAAVEPTLTEDDTETGSDDPPVGLFAGLAVAGLVFVGAAVYVLRRRRRTDLTSNNDLRGHGAPYPG